MIDHITTEPYKLNCSKVVLFQAKYFLICGVDEGIVTRAEFDWEWKNLCNKMSLNLNGGNVTGIAFVPNCGNRFFIASTQRLLQLCDMGSFAAPLQVFDLNKADLICNSILVLPSLNEATIFEDDYLLSDDYSLSDNLLSN